MDSVEVEGGSTIEQKASESKPGRDSNEMKERRADQINGNNGNNKRNPKTFLSMPKLGCFRVENDKDGNFDIQVDTIGEPSNPTHLVVMVNGIIGSPQNWKFGAKQLLRKYPRDVIVHCSKSNTSMLTFDGVDVMGGRLAEEVISVINRHPSAKKISFVGHSLGGLVARYAIARLYERRMTKEVSQGNGDYKSNDSGDVCVEEKFQDRIAGLEPVNFITFATPHVGSRWHKQVICTFSVDVFRMQGYF
uniref:Uncharacterized protein MANES_18G051900 n=1 Tax=Rhizophora mucronata TaxID=61149 RepID=A0A2P2JJX3_RHIMU